MGREQYAMAATFLALVEAGVKVYFYSNGQELKLDTPVEKFMLSAQGFAAQDETLGTSLLNAIFGGESGAISGLGAAGTLAAGQQAAQTQALGSIFSGLGGKSGLS